jgi:hypothetical protein
MLLLDKRDKLGESFKLEAYNTHLIKWPVNHVNVIIFLVRSIDFYCALPLVISPLSFPF